MDHPSGVWSSQAHMHGTGDCRFHGASWCVFTEARKKAQQSPCGVAMFRLCERLQRAAELTKLTTVFKRNMSFCSHSSCHTPYRLKRVAGQRHRRCNFLLDLHSRVMHKACKHGNPNIYSLTWATHPTMGPASAGSCRRPPSGKACPDVPIVTGSAMCRALHQKL